MYYFKLILSYDGSRYQGWQKAGRQGNTSTVSGKLANTLSRILGEPVALSGAFGTEPGMHAIGQAASFQTALRPDPESLRRDLNHYLPKDIAVREIVQMEDAFWASRGIASISLLCRILPGRESDVFRRNQALCLSKEPDIRQMEAVCLELMGKHDFLHFSDGKGKKKTVKELFSLQVLPHMGENRDELHLVIEGNHFLRHMPGILFNAILEAGLDSLSPEDIPLIFQGKMPAPPPCPSKAVFLQNVTYKSLHPSEEQQL